MPRKLGPAEASLETTKEVLELMKKQDEHAKQYQDNVMARLLLLESRLEDLHGALCVSCFSFLSHHRFRCYTAITKTLVEQLASKPKAKTVDPAKPKDLCSGDQLVLRNWVQCSARWHYLFQFEAIHDDSKLDDKSPKMSDEDVHDRVANTFSTLRRTLNIAKIDVETTEEVVAAISSVIKACDTIDNGESAALRALYRAA
jgi:hypothetical protein